MKIYIVIIVLTFFSCKRKEVNKNSVQEVENIKDTIVAIEEEKAKNIEINTITEKPKKGFLFIDIKDIYYQGTELAILGKEQDTIAFFKGNNVYIEGNEYDIIEEEHLYEERIKGKSFDPEYGLFILETKGLNSDGYYIVKLNEVIGYINKDRYAHVLEFKSFDRYVFDGFYYLDNTDFILRVYPHSDSTEITYDNYKKYFYKPVSIEGDWLKLKDDKDCPLGEFEISENDIEGWLQWRRNGEIIVDFAYKCW